MRLQPQRPEYDVVIVGSGAGGGMAAHELTRQGVRVCVLEAGGPWDNTTDAAMMMWPYMTERRGGWIPTRHFGEFDACIGGWSLEGEPYTLAEGTRFDWWRARMVGGRTNHWGRISLRFGPDDFRRGDLDGLSPNWPITYDDLSPWYDRLDRLVGIFGSRENLPNQPDSIFLPPPRPRAYELMVMDASKRLNITCVPARLSVLTRPVNGRQACHYCGQCGRGCSVNANFSSTNVLLAPARATRRMTLITNAMAREVTLGANGRVNGIHYIDKNTGEDRHVRARVVVLAASAFETARLLLNSKSPSHPNGLANASGQIGKHITDTTGLWVGGYIPRLAGRMRYNEDGVGGGHIYMPWWLDNRQLDFPRGYHIEVGGGYGQPGAGFFGGIHRYPNGGGYGAALKADYRRYFGATIGFDGRGEHIPNDNCYLELDPAGGRDRWGIPVLKFHWRWSDHERNQARHMQTTFRGLIEAMGGTVWDPMPTRERDYGLAAGGRMIHELGGTRMGNDPSTSVLTPNCAAHGIPNLYVMDGAPFVSQADKNPTWSIMALAMRSSDHLVRQMRARAI